MSVKALTRMSGVCLLIGSILAFAGERMSYDYAQPTQNAFQSAFYVPGKTLVFVGVVLVLMGLPLCGATSRLRQRCWGRSPCP